MKKAIPLLLLMVWMLSACQGPFRIAGEEPSSEPPVETPEPAEATLNMGCAPEATLRLWAGPDTMNPEVVAQFGALYDVEVRTDTLASDDALISGIRAGNSGYDVVFPSDRAVATMIEGGLLRELNRAHVPNARRLDPNLVGLPSDPENRYTLPYQWGVTGIVYDAVLFEEPPVSWSVLFDVEQVPQHGAPFSMLDDARETIGAALQWLGYAANDTDPAHISEARDVLFWQQDYPNFVGYHSDDVTLALMDGSRPLAHARTADAVRAALENENLAFVVPEEGGIIWQSNLAIPADATNPCAAELFMNYLLQPEVAAQVIAYTRLNSPVPAARLLLDPITQEVLARGFVPDAATWERLEWLQTPANSSPYDNLWTELKSQQPQRSQPQTPMP